eukprot:SAG22_NODE_1762_length_3631_cov_5.724129_3_plen_130_part_00
MAGSRWGRPVQNGAICLDILKDNWSPALTIRTALLSLQALLSAPEPDDPQDAQVAGQYLNNREEYVATAKFWTECYAGPSSGGDEKVGARASSSFWGVAAPVLAAGNTPAAAAAARQLRLYVRRCVTRG